MPLTYHALGFTLPRGHGGGDAGLGPRHVHWLFPSRSLVGTDARRHLSIRHGWMDAPWVCRLLLGINLTSHDGVVAIQCDAQLGAVLDPEGKGGKAGGGDSIQAAAVRIKCGPEHEEIRAQ